MSVNKDLLRGLIERIVSKLDNKITRTELVKYLYLYDLEASREGLETTGVTYKSYYFGPYSDEIIEELERLVKKDKIKERYYVKPDKQYYIYSMDSKSLPQELPREEKEVIDMIIDEHNAEDLEVLLDEVYSTEEYKNVEFGEKIEL